MKEQEINNNGGELPLDFESRQAFSEPPQTPFRPNPVPAAHPEEQDKSATEIQHDIPGRNPADKKAVLPGTAPVPPVRRPVPMITPRNRHSGVAAQSIGTDNCGPVVSLSANELPGAEKNVEILPYGRLFAEARKKAGLSLEDVDAKTLIRADYIQALENEDIDGLPAVTYVIAYARKLGKLYNMPTAQVNNIVSSIRSRLEYVVPEELLVRLEQSGDPSEENIRAVRKFMITVGIAASVLILLIAGIIAISASSGSSKEVSTEPLFPDTFAGELIGHPALKIPELTPR